MHLTQLILWLGFAKTQTHKQYLYVDGYVTVGEMFPNTEKMP